MNSLNLLSNETLLIISLITIILSYLFIKRTRNSNSTPTKKYPPGPKKLPIIGNLQELISDLPHRSLERLSKKYGPLMLLQLGSIPTLVVSSADIAKEIFKTHDVIFSGRPVLHAINKITYNSSSVTSAPYGHHWRELRKVMISELLSPKRVESFRGVREQEVGELVRTIARSTDGVINLSELALSLSNNVVCRVAFGRRFCDDASGDMFRETQELIGGFCLSDYFPWLGWLNKLNGVDKKLDKCFGEMDRFYDEVIKEHKESKRPNKDEIEDVVDVLLRLQKDPTQTISISDDNIKGVLTDIFIAGTDTAAATLVWTMAELIKNPSTMRKAQQEVRDVAGENGKIFETDLSKLNYLKMVIKEGFRLHPPAPLLVPRETTEACVVEGYEIPSRTRIFVNAKAIGRDPKSWGKDDDGDDSNLEEFQPERFLESSVDYRGQHYELLPFGGGRRGCPGTSFATLIVELALANLLCCFDWELPCGIREDELDMEEAVGITMHKNVPLCLVAKVVNVA